MRKDVFMNRLIIVGSPRDNGRCAHLAELLFEACIDECPNDELALAPVSTLDIAPCAGCDACRPLAPARSGSNAEAAGKPGQADAEAPCCAFEDDMAEVYELLDAADELIVVSPVYFAGPPAQLKALLDRLQPYFWTDARTHAKRPATLHVVGEGGDPHGFDPLVGIVRSALSCAGFGLERVLDWVGRIDENGEITAEAVEYPLAPCELPSTPSPEQLPDELPAVASQKPKLDLGAGAVKPSGNPSSKPANKPSNKSAGGKKPSRNQKKGSGRSDARRAHEKRSSGKHGG